MATGTGLPDDWVLAGKLGPPRQQVTTSTRHTLLDRLDRARELPLSVITAPAGFGKSTLLAQWHQRLVNAGDTHVAWLTLDGDDGETFCLHLRYLYRHPETRNRTRSIDDRT